MFRFAHPEFLYGLYLVPLLIAALWLSIRRRSRLIDRFAGKALQPVLVPSFSRKKAALRSGLIVMSVILLLVAASDPQIGTKIENVKESGIELYVLLDVSLSMQAQDIKPSRLEKAKLELSNLLPDLRGDRVGLIVFAGEPFIQFPLTSDYSAADLFLSAASTSSVPEQGTAFAPAIDLALKSFETASKDDPSDKAERVIVMFSDGGDHEGHIEEAIDRAKKDGVKIYTVGFGSADGAPIPVYNDQGQQVGFKKDDKGNVVLAKLHPEELEKIASQTGGKFFRAENGRDELEMIYNDLSKIRKSELGEKRVTDYVDRFYYFLAPAILLLLIEFFMSERRSILLGKLNEKLGTVR